MARCNIEGGVDGDDNCGQEEIGRAAAVTLSGNSPGQAELGARAGDVGIELWCMPTRLYCSVWFYASPFHDALFLAWSSGNGLAC